MNRLSNFSHVSFFLLLLFALGYGNTLDESFYDRCASEAESWILKSWEEQKKLPIELTTATLIAEGITDSSTIAQFQQHFARLLSELKNEIKVDQSPKEKGKKIFEYLHENVFRKYLENARLYNTFTRSHYNCATATILYYDLANQFNLPLVVYTTPTHVFLAIKADGEKLVIELTDPEDGFNYKGNQQEYIRHLLKYKLISPEELNDKGAERIYGEYIQQRREILPEQLLGIIYNNLSAKYMSDHQYAAALCAIRKAILMDTSDQEYRRQYKLVLYRLVERAEAEGYTQYLDELLDGLRLFTDDYEFRSSIWEMMTALINEFVYEKKDYKTSVEIVNQLKKLPDQNEKVARKIDDLAKLVHTEWILTLQFRGDYEAAYEKIIALQKRFPKDAKLKDHYVDITLKYANYLSQYGHINQVTSLLDSLINNCPEYPIASQTYVDIILRYIAGNINLGKDLEFTRDLLLKAYSLDPKNIYVKRDLARVYHELAMREVRGGNFFMAKKIVQKGLQYDPNDQLLQDALGYINDVISEQTTRKK